ncbi:MAG: hypothetical protein N4A68_02715 [Maledivibacter sp.]|nr:hypothetical protein [Maledivibacter sp.]
MASQMFISIIAFGLFIVCPRMAGMMHVINKHSNASILRTVLVGTLLSIPLLLLMVLAFNYMGIWGAIIICVLTDFAAAFIMNEISNKAAIETCIIAIFVILGVKLSPMISSLILGF